MPRVQATITQRLELHIEGQERPCWGRKTSESVSRSVVSDSLWPHGLWPTSSSVQGILQARILEWVAIFFSRESSWPRFSCIAGRLFTVWATREVGSAIQSQMWKINPKGGEGGEFQAEKAERVQVQRSELKMTQKGRQSWVRDEAGRGGAGSGHEGIWHLLGSKLKGVKLESDGQFWILKR